MTTHAPSVPGDRGAIRLAERSAHELLHTTLNALHPALNICNWTLVHTQMEGRAESVTLGEVDQAARLIFLGIQDALGSIGAGCVLQGRLRRDTWYALDAAHRTLEVVTAQPWRGKRTQLATMEGRSPLTLCFGRSVRRAPELAQFGKPDSSWAEDIAYTHFGDGCGIIFGDSLRRFARYCPKCRKKPGRYFINKAIAKRTAMDEGRVPVPRSDQEGRRIDAWRATCTACGERFETFEPRRRRCERCHRGHRARA